MGIRAVGVVVGRRGRGEGGSWGRESTGSRERL